MNNPEIYRGYELRMIDNRYQIACDYKKHGMDCENQILQFLLFINVDLIQRNLFQKYN